MKTKIARKNLQVKRELLKVLTGNCCTLLQAINHCIYTHLLIHTVILTCTIILIHTTVLYLYILIHTYYCVILSQVSSLDKSCYVICKATAKKKPVCASDKQSYPSKCEVRRQRICFGKTNLQWVYEGECLETSNVPQPSRNAGIIIFNIPIFNIHQF